METIKTEIKLYEYDELNEEAKEKAFNTHLDFLYSNPKDYEDEDGNIKYDDYETYTEKELKEEVETSIEINKYLFFENGEMADIILFSGKHKKAGITEFYFHGKTYILN